MSSLTAENVTCPGSYFKCKNNRCIPGRWRCDYDDDCKDGSDEEDCAPRICLDVEFQCLTIQQCIPNFQRLVVQILTTVKRKDR